MDTQAKHTLFVPGIRGLVNNGAVGGGIDGPARRSQLKFKTL